MTIKYSLDVKDCDIFSDYLIKTSPLLRKTVRKGQLWWACGPLVGGLLVSIIKGAPPEKTVLTLAYLGIFLSLPLFLLYRHYFTYCNKRQMKKLHKGGSYPGLIGDHQMTVSEEYLVEKTEYNEHKVTWNSVSNIETTPDYTYIFTGEVTAYIVPHRKINEGDTEQFLARLQQTYQRATG